MNIMQYTRFATIVFAVFGMEITCLYLLLQVANRTVNERLSVMGLLVIFIVSFMIFKSFGYLIKSRRLINLICWIIGWPLIFLITLKIQLFPQIPIDDLTWMNSIPLAFVKILTSFDPVLLLILSSAVLWRLGARLATKTWDFPAVLSEFQFSLIVLILNFFIAHLTSTELKLALPLTLVYFAFGLIGIAIARDHENRWWSSSLKQWHWPVMLLFSVGLILLVGMLIGIFLSPELLQLIIKGLKWIWHVFDIFMQWLATLIPHSLNPDETLGAPEMPGGQIPPEDETFHFPEWLVSTFKIFWTVLVVSLLIIAIWRITSYIMAWMLRTASNSGAVHESLRVNPWREWWNSIKRFLCSFKIKKRQPVEKSLSTPEAFLIRQIYAQWLRWMTKAGFPRKQAQTPLEYQSEVEGIFGNQQEAVKEMTHQYMLVRYGAASPSSNEIERIKEKWSILKSKNLKNTPKGSRINGNDAQR